MVQELTIDDVRSFVEETGVFFVIFTKKDGTERELYGTIDVALIPEKCLPKNSSSSTKKKKEGLFTVFDYIKQEWRSFYADSVKYIEALPITLAMQTYNLQMEEEEVEE